MKLYEISEAMTAIQAMIDEGVPAEQLVDSLQDMQEDFEQKAKDILHVLMNMGSDITAFKAEEARLKERRLIMERQKSRLEDYLRDNLAASEWSEISNGVLTAKVGKGRPVAEIVDEALIPDEYMTIKTSVAVDKKELLAALKENEVPGAVLGTSKPSLTIK
jgi:hypothetical protein